MTGVFDVIQGGQGIGRVKVRREGLYCRISCRCQRFDNEIHRLYAGGERIGVLVPAGEELVLETRVAAKRLKEDCIFSLDDGWRSCGKKPCAPWRKRCALLWRKN